MTTAHPEFLVACLCAAWCGTCRDYRAGFEALAARFPEARFLWLDVEDDGADGLPDVEGHGIGLANTRARLQVLYGDEAVLSIEATANGGTRVGLRLPRRHAIPASTRDRPARDLRFDEVRVP